jgi:hypothetical protein
MTMMLSGFSGDLGFLETFLAPAVLLLPSRNAGVLYCAATGRQDWPDSKLEDRSLERSKR